MSIVQDQVPLDPRRGKWELVRAAVPGDRDASLPLDLDAELAAIAQATGTSPGEWASALGEFRRQLGVRADDGPALLRALREARAERAGSEPGQATGRRGRGGVHHGAGSAATTDDAEHSPDAEAGGEGDEAPAIEGDEAPRVEGSRRRRAAAGA